MKNTLRFFAFFAVLVLALTSTATADNLVVESARAHAAAGALGCTVSGVTTANPGVVTCVAAHGLADGDQVQITGVGGATQANVLGYAKVTGASTTTFALYSEATLTTGVNVTGTYTSGGLVSEAADVHALTGDFTLRLIVNSVTAAKKAVIAIQDSADGFAADIVTLAVVNVSGSPDAKAFTWRKYQLPSSRIGVTNGRLRVSVLSLDSGTTVTTSLILEQ